MNIAQNLIGIAFAYLLIGVIAVARAQVVTHGTPALWRFTFAYIMAILIIPFAIASVVLASEGSIHVCGKDCEHD